ncbi:uncharacterized protein [Acropora muricata]|uniref:uncharacterized protein isoform X5 n=1 Tax=Acropora muricata TaxID=159855 RepID=UPI0034E4C959
MAQFPTYVSRLDPQFRRFVSVVNVYASSETSKDNLSEKEEQSLKSSISCPDLSKEVISVDAYTEEEWPRTRREVSEFFLEYVNVLSSDSETSILTDKDTGFSTCSSTSPGQSEFPRNISISEQPINHGGIPDEDDSVFWSDGWVEDLHVEKRGNQRLPAVLTQTRKPLYPSRLSGSLSNLDGEYRNRNKRHEESRHVERYTEKFSTERDAQVNESVSSTTFCKEYGKDWSTQENPRQRADSLEDLSSVDSELGYTPDFIEDGYSSTSSADSNFVCFALVGNKRIEKMKRKKAPKYSLTEHQKKHGHVSVDSSRNLPPDDNIKDSGLKARVVTGVSGGPAVRVVRDKDWNRSKKPREYTSEDARRYFVGTADGGISQGTLERPPTEQERTASSSRESVFALIAAPENSSGMDEQGSRHERKRDTEEGFVHGLAGVHAHKRVLSRSSRIYSSEKVQLGSKESEAEISSRPSANRNLSPSKMELVASGQKIRDQDQLNDIPNNDLMRVSRQRVKSDTFSRLTQGSGCLLQGSGSGEHLSAGEQMKQGSGVISARQIRRGSVQDKVDFFKLHSTKKQVIRKPSLSRQRPEDNPMETKPQYVANEEVSPARKSPEAKHQDARTLPSGKESDLPLRKQDSIWTSNSESDVIYVGGDDDIKDQSSLVGRSSKSVLGPHGHHVNNTPDEKLELNMFSLNDEALLTKDSSNNGSSGLVPKAKFVTPLNKAIRETSQTCSSEMGDAEWKDDFKEKGKSSRTDAGNWLVPCEDKKGAVEIAERTVKVKKGVETVEPVKAVLRDSMKEKAISRKAVLNSFVEHQGLTPRESASSVGRNILEGDISSCNYSSQGSIIAVNQEKNCGVKLTETARQSVVCDRQIADAVSRSNSRSLKTQRPKFNIVNERKNNQNERQEMNPSVASENPRLCSKLKVDLSRPGVLVGRPSEGDNALGSVARSDEDLALLKRVNERDVLEKKPISETEGNARVQVSLKRDGGCPIIEKNTQVDGAGVNSSSSDMRHDDCVSTLVQVSKSKTEEDKRQVQTPMEEGATSSPIAFSVEKNQSCEKEKMEGSWQFSTRRTVCPPQQEDGVLCGKGIENFEKRTEALTTLDFKESSTAEKLEENEFVVDGVSGDRTDPREERPPTVKAMENINRYDQGLNERRGILEDVCFVAFDDNENASSFEIGFLPETDPLNTDSLGYMDSQVELVHGHDETLLDCNTEMKFGKGMVNSKLVAFVKDDDLFSTTNVNTPREIKIEVEEVVCSCEDYARGSSPTEVLTSGPTTATVSEKSQSIFDGDKRGLIDAKSGQVCSLEKNGKIIQSQLREGSSCSKDIHGDCPHKDLLQWRNQEQERNHHEMAEASAKTQKTDASFDVKDVEETFNSSSVTKVSDKECQFNSTEVIGDSPVYETKESQTSNSYQVANAECQTSESLEVSFSERSLQTQNVEWQTDLLSNDFASVAVQVELPNGPLKEDLEQCESSLKEDVILGEHSIDRDCQTAPDCELLLLSSKEIQVDTCITTRDLPVSSHPFSVHHKECQTSGNNFVDIANSMTSNAYYDSCPKISIASQECQTSFEIVETSIQCEILTLQSRDDPAVKSDEKWCQTSLGSYLLLTASKECQTRSLSHDCAEDEVTGVESKISTQSKECQTLLDNEFLDTALKDFQKTLLSCLSEELEDCLGVIAASDDSKGPTENKSTLAAPIQCSFSEFNPSVDLTGLRSRDKKFYDTKSSQTFVDCDHLDANSKESQTPAFSFTPQEKGEEYKICESKQCQTSATYDVLLASSKECQTSPADTCGEGECLGEATEISVQQKECQTYLDFDLALAASKQCQTPWLVTFRDEGNRTKETGVSQRDSGCQTFVDSDFVLATSKQSQTVFGSFELGGERKTLNTNKECQTDIERQIYYSKETQTLSECFPEFLNEVQAFRKNSKECQTDVSSNLLFAALENRGDSISSNTQTEESLSKNNATYQTKDCQTAIIALSSKCCQTSSLGSSTDCHSRESQTVTGGVVYQLSSKECQTIPYSLEELRLLLSRVEGSSEVTLSNGADTKESPYSSRSLPKGLLQDVSRRSPDENSFDNDGVILDSTAQEDDVHLCRTVSDSPPKHLNFVFPPDSAEIGCQAMLCHCGNFVDEHDNSNSWSCFPTDSQSGAAMRVSEGMQKEQASLIKQLDILRDMNQKLRDDKDAIEAAHEAKKNKVSRQGSQMSKYVRRKRNAGPSETWGNQSSVGSFSGEEVDGSSRDGVRAKRRSKRGDMKKQGSVMSSYFGVDSNNSRQPDSTSLQQSIQEEEAEFEGDPSLELVPEEKVRELERPAWATKIIKSYVQTKEKAEEENRELSVNDEELEEEVFRKRKVELTTAGTGDASSKDAQEEFDMSLSEELSDESGCASDEIPSSPRAAPVGKDNDVGRVRSRDTSEAGASTGSGHSTPERVFKVVFVGDSGVGKSSFIHRFCHDDWKASFTATIGVDFQIRTMTVQGRYIALQLWDTAGQERFRSITKQYFRKADGVVVFYDVTMEASFLHIKNWMLSVEEGTDEGTAIMIVGNKTDLIEDENGRPVKSQDGRKLAEEYNALYTETSAKTGFNIQESMEELAKMLQDREDEYMQSVLNLVQHKPVKKKCCN